MIRDCWANLTYKNLCIFGLIGFPYMHLTFACVFLLIGYKELPFISLDLNLSGLQKSPVKIVWGLGKYWKKTWNFGNPGGVTPEKWAATKVR